MRDRGIESKRERERKRGGESEEQTERESKRERAMGGRESKREKINVPSTAGWWIDSGHSRS